MFSQASPLLAHWGSIGYTSRSHIDDNDKYGGGDDDDGTEDSGRMGLKILVVFLGAIAKKLVARASKERNPGAFTTSFFTVRQLTTSLLLLYIHN